MGKGREGRFLHVKFRPHNCRSGAPKPPVTVVNIGLYQS